MSALLCLTTEIQSKDVNLTAAENVEDSGIVVRCDGNFSDYDKNILADADKDLTFDPCRTIVDGTTTIVHDLYNVVYIKYRHCYKRITCYRKINGFVRF